MILSPKSFVCQHCIVSPKRFSGFDGDDYLFSFLKRILLLVANLLTRITNNIVSINCNVYLVGRFNYLIQFTVGYHNNR